MRAFSRSPEWGQKQKENVPLGSRTPKRCEVTGFEQGSNPGKEQKMSKKDKLAVYLTPEKKAELERRRSEERRVGKEC